MSNVVRALKCILSRLLPDLSIVQKLRELEEFRLGLLLRALQQAPFNAKMTALNEMNRLLTTLTFLPSSFPSFAGTAGIFASTAPRPLRQFGSFLPLTPHLPSFFRFSLNKRETLIFYTHTHTHTHCTSLKILFIFQPHRRTSLEYHVLHLYYAAIIDK